MCGFVTEINANKSLFIINQQVNILEQRLS